MDEKWCMLERWYYVALFVVSNNNSNFLARIQRYCDLTTNSTAEINCLSIVVLFYSVYASEMNLKTQNLFVVVSAVLMAP